MKCEECSKARQSGYGLCGACWSSIVYPNHYTYKGVTYGPARGGW